MEGKKFSEFVVVSPSFPVFEDDRRSPTLGARSFFRSVLKKKGKSAQRENRILDLFFSSEKEKREKEEEERDEMQMQEATKNLKVVEENFHDLRSEKERKEDEQDEKDWREVLEEEREKTKMFRNELEKKQENFDEELIAAFF